MEQLNEIIGLIGSIVATIFLPILGVFMFYDAKKKRKMQRLEKQRPKVRMRKLTV